jgi:hypothetical protein
MKGRVDSGTLYTVLGVLAILGVIAFIGIARPKFVVERLDGELTYESNTEEGTYRVEKTIQLKPGDDIGRALGEAMTGAMTVAMNEAMKNSGEIPIPMHPGERIVKQQRQGVRPGEGRGRDPLIESGNISYLPFARDAVDRCEPECNGSQACLLACKRLGVSEYARRILSEDPSPAAIAKKTAGECAGYAWKGELLEDERKAVSSMLAPTELFDRPDLLERFKWVSAYLGKVEKVEKGNALGQALCLMEAALTTELAIVEAASASDSHSEMFYREIDTELLKALTEIRDRLRKEVGV